MLLCLFISHWEGGLYCTFVDFCKTFGNVWRTGLWKKLLEHDINGRCFKIIYNMYDNIKSCVMYNDMQSNWHGVLDKYTVP